MSMSHHVPPAINLTDITVDFGQGPVLDQISLTLFPGTATCLIGMSASGKTVLAKVISGLIRPIKGTGHIDDLNIYASPVKERQMLMRRIGFLFQKAGLFDSLPIWHNITFQQLETRTWLKKQAKEEAIKLLASVGLDSHVADLYPADLSGGMQKRVGVARALAGSPDILILDEPTAGLDPVMSRAICELVTTLRTRRPMTVLVISSDMDVATRIADQVIMIHNRKIHWSGAAHEAATCGNKEVEQLMAKSATGPLQL